MHSHKVIHCVVSLLVLVVSAEAQEFGKPRAQKLDITITDADCDALPPRVQVVFGGNDGRSIPGEQNKDHRCRYTVENPDGSSFLVGDDTEYSLRLGSAHTDRTPRLNSARTDCRRLMNRVFETSQLAVGKLSFRVELDSASNLTIRTQGPQDVVKYTRFYKRNPNLAESRDCSEGAFVEDVARVKAVHFPREQLELDFGPESKFFIDRLIQSSMSWDQENAHGVTFKPAGAGAAHVRQVATAQLNDTPPLDSRNTAALIAQILREKKFESLTLIRE